MSVRGKVIELVVLTVRTSHSPCTLGQTEYRATNNQLTARSEDAPRHAESHVAAKGNYAAGKGLKLHHELVMFRGLPTSPERHVSAM